MTDKRTEPDTLDQRRPRQDDTRVRFAVRRPTHTNHRFKLMSWLIAFVAIGTAGDTTWGFQFVHPFTTQPSRTEFKGDVSRIEMDVSLRRVIVSGTINGKGPFKVLVDTTATRFTIDDDVAKEIGLKAVDIPRLDDLPRPMLPGTAVRIDTLGLGQVVFHGFNALTADLDILAGGFRRYDAAVPFTMFRDCLLTLDYPNRTLILEQGELPTLDGNDILPFTDSRGCPALNLDSGPFAGSICISTKSKHAFTMQSSTFGDPKSGTIQANKKKKGRRHVADFDTDTPISFAPIQLGRHELLGLPISYTEERPSFGYELLKMFTLTFDQKNHRVRWTRAGPDTISLFPHSRFGVVFVRHMTDLTIAYIIPGSPASRSPLKAGDRIKEFETKPSQSRSDEFVRRKLQESETVLMKVEKYGMDMMIVLSVRD